MLVHLKCSFFLILEIRIRILKSFFQQLILRPHISYDIWTMSGKVISTVETLLEFEEITSMSRQLFRFRYILNISQRFRSHPWPSSAKPSLGWNISFFPFPFIRHIWWNFKIPHKKNKIWGSSLWAIIEYKAKLEFCRGVMCTLAPPAFVQSSKDSRRPPLFKVNTTHLPQNDEFDT